MKNEIEKLPETVDEAYEKILNRVDGPAWSQAINILHIIVGATRALRLAARAKYSGEN